MPTSTPVSDLNSSLPRCWKLPTPADAKFSCPGFSLASAISSFTELREFIERGIDRVCGRDNQQSVTVGLRFRCGFSADDASCPAAVVRDDLFAEPFSQFGGDE